MDNIIKELIQIETMARTVTKKIEQDKKNLNINIKKKSEEIEKKIEEETKKRIQEINKNALNESNKKISQIRIDMQTRFSNMEMEFENNKEKWQDEIFNSIVGR